MVPGMGANLFSVTEAMRKGFAPIFHPDKPRLEVDGDKLESMLYIIGCLLRMSLLVALPDSTDVACLFVSGVLDAIARHLPQNNHSPAV